MGTEKSKGYGIFSLSGHVTNPGQYEAPLGITLRELIDLAGGIREGHELKFWTPGGSSHPDADRRAPRRPARLRGASAPRARCSAPARCRSSTRPPAWCGRCCAGPSSTSTSPAASARRAARAPGGWCRSWPALEKGAGHRGRPRPAARPVRQHPRPVVLRARRRRDQPDHVARSSTSATSTSPTSSTAAARSTRPPRPSSPPQEPRHDTGFDRLRPASTGPTWSP